MAINPMAYSSKDVVLDVVRTERTGMTWVSPPRSTQTVPHCA